MAVIHLGQAVFIDDDPITPKRWAESESAQIRFKKRWRSETQQAMDWFDRMAEEKGLSIHPWVEFYSLERAGVGIALVKDEKEVVDHVELREVPYFEPINTGTPAEYLEDDSGFMFEEYPDVIVENKADWERLFQVHKNHYEKKEWGAVEDAEYDGPGVYDGRDMSKFSDSADDWELGALQDQADQLTDYIFWGGLLPSDLHGEEWVEAFEKLVTEAAEEAEEEY
jgi:hypothetical protein